MPRPAPTLYTLCTSKFLGMRFAAPAQRYTLPQPVEPWKGIFNATTLPAMCPQLFNSSVVGKEDCLFINVWTNALGSDPSRIYVPTLAPVYVYIYGLLSVTRFVPICLLLRRLCHSHFSEASPLLNAALHLFPSCLPPVSVIASVLVTSLCARLQFR